MIKIEKTEVSGWDTAIRGMRNPLNSWDKSDTGWISNPWDEETPKQYLDIDYDYAQVKVIGDNDLALMKKLVKAGSDHRKFMRFITVSLDITAPLYWWKEFDTYKIGTTANSCSTMHTIHKKEFNLDDFSHEHLHSRFGESYEAMDCLVTIIRTLNKYRDLYLETKEKFWWWQLIQLLPTSYNQKRTVLLNYEVLRNMYHSRKVHKLDEWRDFCKWIETLPYHELITEEC